MPKKKSTNKNQQVKGIRLLQDPLLSKGTSYSDEERDALGLRGLLPPKILSQEIQLTKLDENYGKLEDDLDKYVYLSSLQDRNETLFYRFIMENLVETMPIIYTPTVGRACQSYRRIFRRSRGLYISIKDKGKIAEVLQNWPRENVSVIVVTDGERILGLGDLGSDGMGIPIGKLALYTACAGIPPGECLPIMLDVGTEDKVRRNDPLYLGTPEPRTRGKEYDEFVDEFMEAVSKTFPDALIQFEDFGNRNASRFLQKYQNDYRMFNDDIQGTAAVTLAGLLTACSIQDKKLSEQKILFFGAGTAGLGIGNLIVKHLVNDGLDENDAKKHCWFFDSKGLIVSGREGLNAEKSIYAHQQSHIDTFMEAINVLKPTAIVGVAGQPDVFDKPVLNAMADINDQPIVFALSNPTSQSECTAEEAFLHTNGSVLFASGSPFPDVEWNGKTHKISQGNNAYIFPGIGLGICVSGASKVTDDMFLKAAESLSDAVTEKDISQGRLYPPLKNIRNVSVAIASAVGKCALEQRLSSNGIENFSKEKISSILYKPIYKSML
ncbi:MAG: NAD-dependent malic enzyme [Candidatus Marinimicrobia bacterium]|jgi:malate dehydrogenase (oxaloacetate-decarboxylating)(NADP+)|nr:NAD-dependent malic enzyme [Candidatus Neomarinimicrobiota bacterium]MDP7071804.1 NAD-dependent malic enzyme [Candidatus Neomarinimicrobiota bacterium]